MAKRERQRRQSLERFDLVDAAYLLTQRILIVGLGRVGMAFLRALLQWPIGGIIAVDHDTIDVHDRLQYPDTKERFKVRAAEHLVAFCRPAILYQGVLMQVCEDTISRLRQLLEEVAIVLWAADDGNALQLACQVAYSSVPMVGVAVAEGGSYGEIVYSLPSQTACLACTLNVAAREPQQGAASLPVDVDAIVSVAMSVALGLMLVDRKGFDLFAHLLEPSHNLIVVHQRPNRFTTSSNELVPSLTRLLRVDAACDICRVRS